MCVYNVCVYNVCVAGVSVARRADSKLEILRIFYAGRVTPMFAAPAALRGARGRSLVCGLARRCAAHDPAQSSMGASD